MSQTGGEPSTPRAMIHKRILDSAKADPSASMAEIAGEIPGASTGLVERVLEQYGDPAQAGPEEQADAEGQENQRVDDQNRQNGSGEVSVSDTPDLNGKANRGNGVDEEPGDEDWSDGEDQHPDLSENQVRALRLVAENPDASQGDIAEEFDVTRVTVNRWLNDIPGFRWERRRELAPRILDGSDVAEAADREKPDRPEGRERPGELEPLRERLEAMERRLDRMEADRSDLTAERSGPGLDPELARKVVHASMKSDLITEEEELRLLEELIG